MNYRIDKDGKACVAIGMEGSNADLKARGWIEYKDFIRLPSGSLYVKKDSMIAETLFCRGGTARGTFKRLKRGIKFFDQHGKEQFFLVDNAHNEQFFVSCWKGETSGGKTRYMYSTSESDEKAIGIHGMSYGDACRYAEKLAKETKI